MQAAEKLHCPHCGTSDVYRIHRSWVIREFSFLLPLRRYACYSCLHKFYLVGRNQGNNHTLNPPQKASRQ